MTKIDRVYLFKPQEQISMEEFKEMVKSDFENRVNSGYRFEEIQFTADFSFAVSYDLTVKGPYTCLVNGKPFANTADFSGSYFWGRGTACDAIRFEINDFTDYSAKKVFAISDLESLESEDPLTIKNAKFDEEFSWEWERKAERLIEENTPGEKVTDIIITNLAIEYSNVKLIKVPTYLAILDCKNQEEHIKYTNWGNLPFCWTYTTYTGYGDTPTTAQFKSHYDRPTLKEQAAADEKAKKEAAEKESADKKQQWLKKTRWMYAIPAAVFALSFVFVPQTFLVNLFAYSGIGLLALLIFYRVKKHF